MPERDRRPYRRLIAAPVGKEFRGVVLSDRWIGFWMHFQFGEKRSVRCPGETLCDLCGQRIGRKWYAFLEAMCLSIRQPVILVLPHGAVGNCPALLSLNGQLRGAEVRVGRFKPLPRSPVYCRLDMNYAHKGTLPGAVDLYAALLATWRIPDDRGVADGEIPLPREGK